MNSKLNSKINYLVSHATPNISLCAMAYRVIKSAVPEERPQLLQKFVCGYKFTPTTGDLNLPQVMDAHDQMFYLMKYGQMVDMALWSFLKEDYTAEEFYSKLWEYLDTAVTLPDEKVRIFALYNCAIDSRLPYYQIDLSHALSMSDENYAASIKRIGDETIGRLNFILNAEYQQRTQPASLALQLMEPYNYEDRVVLMTQLISQAKHGSFASRLAALEHLVPDSPNND